MLYGLIYFPNFYQDDIDCLHYQDNYRYTLAQADPLAGDNWEQELAAGKPLPSKHYRCKLSEHVLLALHDKGEWALRLKA